MARHMHDTSLDGSDDPDDLDSPMGIEPGTLAIEQQENKLSPQKGFWERRSKTYKPPPVGTTQLRFEILVAHIMPPEGVDSKMKRYVVYELTVRQDGTAIDTQPVTIERRYTDFRELYIGLKRYAPHEMSTVFFPNKVLMGNFSSDLIAERSSAFEAFLTFVVASSKLRDCPALLHFLQHHELCRACQYLDERRNEQGIPLLENCFRLLNKIFMDRSRPVLLILCRLVAACTTSPPHLAAERWAAVALARFDTLCDIDLLPLYIPLLHTCAHLWWQRGLDQKPITDRLQEMYKKGINTAHTTSLMQAIHKIDPRTELI